MAPLETKAILLQQHPNSLKIEGGSFALQASQALFQEGSACLHLQLIQLIQCLLNQLSALSAC
jgi:hypothetical protein